MASGAVSEFINWSAAKIKSRKKQNEIEQLIKETATRAAMTAFSVDLAAKFKDKHLVEEIIAHQVLADKTKTEAIAIFVGPEADDEATFFVERFYDGVSRITATAEESFPGRKTLEVAEATQGDVKTLLDMAMAGGNAQKDLPAIKFKKPVGPKKLIIPEEIVKKEMPYVHALMRIYGEIERIDNFDLGDFDKHSNHKLHFQRQRKDYYSAEFVRHCMRDSYADEGDNQFEILEDEVYDGVVDVYENDYDSGKKRLGEVLVQAARIPVDKCWASRDTDWIGNSEKKGVCHILVNDERIRGWLDEDR